MCIYNTNHLLQVHRNCQIKVVSIAYFGLNVLYNNNRMYTCICVILLSGIILLRSRPIQVECVIAVV